MHRLTGLIAAIAGSTLAGCAHVTNVALCTDGDGHPVANCDYAPDPQAAYRFAPEKKKDRDTLVVVTFSGGGIRASALAYGTLKALAGLPGVHGASLLDEVDVISSVSGGSVTAGWYALKGRDGIDPKKDGARFEEFLHGDWTSTIAWRGLNPVALARYTFTPYQRSDMLSEFFSDKLFGDATYGDVLKRYNTDGTQPYVILNATDLGHEIGFPFTQGRFDLLCSDLARYRLADAVTASANFPFAFSAIGIRNYSNCPVQNGQAWLDRGPSQWADYYDTFDRESSTPSSFQLSELRAARQAKHLVHPQPDDLTLHLLDGGLIDNLGIRSTLAIEDDPARVPGLYLRLGPKHRPDGYNKIRRVLYVVVNARTRDPASVDKKVYPPGVFTQNVQMLNTGVDSSILVDQDFLAADLEAISTRKSTNVFLSKRAHSDATNDVSDLPRPWVEVITVDFEMIPDPTCREQYWKLGTNWGLPAADIDKLIELAQTTVRASSNLKGFYREATGSVPEVLEKSPSFANACAGLQ
jgi:NTE family protein